MLDLIGNQNNFDFLLRAFKSGKPQQAYLLVGPQSIGKETLVKKLLVEIFCDRQVACGECSSCRQILNLTHPDVWWLERLSTKQDISIDQIRIMQNFIALGSLNYSWRVVVINDAHFLNAESGNALLKSLEEPSKKTVIILISSDPHRLLPTIKSRCQILNLNLVSAEEIKKNLIIHHVNDSQAEKIARLAAGRPGIAVAFMLDNNLLNQEELYSAMLINLLKGKNFNEFVKFIESDIKETAESDLEARSSALRLLEVWRRTIRDIILFKLSLYNLVQHQNLLSELEESSNLTVVKLIKLLLLIQKAYSDLQSNAHIKLTLEGLAYNLSVKS